MGRVSKNQPKEVLIASCNKEFISVELSIAKSLAIRWGLQVAKDLKLDKMLVQSNVMFVVDCINAFEFSIVLDNIVANCKLLLNSFKEVYIILNKNFNDDGHKIVDFLKRIGSKT